MLRMHTIFGMKNNAASGEKNIAAMLIYALRDELFDEEHYAIVNAIENHVNKEYNWLPSVRGLRQVYKCFYTAQESDSPCSAEVVTDAAKRGPFVLLNVASSIVKSCKPDQRPLAEASLRCAIMAIWALTITQDKFNALSNSQLEYYHEKSLGNSLGPSPFLTAYLRSDFNDFFGKSLNRRYSESDSSSSCSDSGGCGSGRSSPGAKSDGDGARSLRLSSRPSF